MQVKLVSLSPYSLCLQEIATTAAGRRIKRLFKVGAWGRLLCFIVRAMAALEYHLSFPLEQDPSATPSATTCMVAEPA